MTKLGEYTMLVINKRTGQTFTDKAPFNGGGILGDITASLRENVDPTATTMGSMGSMGNGTGVGNAGYQQSKSATHGGSFIDNSQNLTKVDIKNDISIQQQFKQLQVNHMMKEINFEHDRKMEIMRGKEECRRLCIKPFKNAEEIMREIELLNWLCGVSSVCHGNIEKWSKAFMNHNFPEVGYKSNNMLKRVGNHYGTIQDVGSGNYTSLATTAIGYVADKPWFQGLGGF